MSLTTKSTESESEGRCFLSSYRNRSIMHHPTTLLVPIQPSRKPLWHISFYSVGLANPSN